MYLLAMRIIQDCRKRNDLKKIKDYYFHKAKSDGYVARSVYKLEEIDKKLKKIHWFDSEVFRIYYLGEVNGKQFSLNSMEKETGISKSTLYKSIKKVKKILKC